MKVAKNGNVMRGKHFKTSDVAHLNQFGTRDRTTWPGGKSGGTEERVSIGSKW